MTLASTDIRFTVMVEKDQNDPQFCVISLPNNTDITTLKLVLETQCNIPPNQQILFFNSKLISNDNKQTLLSLNIKNEDVIICRNQNSIDQHLFNNSNRISLDMPTFSPNLPLPELPQWLKMDAKLLQQRIRSDQPLVQQLLHQNPTFAQALIS